jgi:acid phosphatase type 7
MMRFKRSISATVLAATTTAALLLLLMHTVAQAQNNSADSARPFVLLAAGDIAQCDSIGSSQTAAQIQAVLAARISASAGISVAALGDNAYESGTIIDYQECYDPTWGRFLARTLPVVGNHEYETPDAAGYVAYFGARAGDPAKLYYSERLPNNWLFIALNSNCSQVGGCQEGSPQEEWLRSVLTANKGRCIVAAIHQLPFSSGQNGDELRLQPLAKALYEYDADVLIGGHDHNYQRYVPMDHLGRPDVDGFREFVVGTGGSNYGQTITPTVPITSAVMQMRVFGVIRFELMPNFYTWEFRAVDGSYVDSGEGSCTGQVQYRYLPVVTTTTGIGE